MRTGTGGRRRWSASAAAPNVPWACTASARVSRAIRQRASVLCRATLTAATPRRERASSTRTGTSSAREAAAASPVSSDTSVTSWDRRRLATTWASRMRVPESAGYGRIGVTTRTRTSALRARGAPGAPAGPGAAGQCPVTAREERGAGRQVGAIERVLAVETREKARPVGAGQELQAEVDVVAEERLVPGVRGRRVREQVAVLAAARRAEVMHHGGVRQVPDAIARADHAHAVVRLPPERIRGEALVEAAEPLDELAARGHVGRARGRHVERLV